MKLTLQQAQNISNSPIFGKSLPIQVSYKFSKLGKALVEELKLVEEHRQKLIQQCEGTLTEDKSQYKFSEEQGKKFQTEMQSLLETPIEVPFEPISLAALGDVALSPNELLGIEPLILVEE